MYTGFLIQCDFYAIRQKKIKMTNKKVQVWLAGSAKPLLLTFLHEAGAF
jgi:hypothetical protein